ncbi:YbjQ family protein [Myceligenerans halotolerans]
MTESGVDPFALGVAVILLLPLLVLLLTGVRFLVGFARRGRLIRYLDAEEPRLGHLFRTNVEQQHDGPISLVAGNVAYAADAPSRWAAQWRALVGGRAASLSLQTDLARRLAVVRMLQEAERLSATGVSNVRLETSELASGGAKNPRTMVIELLAYGNALLPHPSR